jgi:uncharacterized membrane protein
LVLRLETKQVALISAFAALIVMVTRLPGIPIIGAPGAKLQLSVVIYPIIGILLGGSIGAITVLVGNLVAWLIPPSTLLGFLMVPPGALAALVAGSLRSKQKVFNWKLALAVLGALNTLWYISPVGLDAPFYPVLHWAALILMVLFRGKISSFLDSDSKREVVLGTWVCSFAALMSDSMAGNLIFICAVGWIIPLRSVLDAVTNLGMFWLNLGIPRLPFTGLAALFMGALVITAIERITMTIVSTMIGSAVIRILGKGRMMISS